MRLSSWVGSGKRRLIASGGLVALAGAAVAARYVLFQSGILYGEAAATMASLAVAGVVIAPGYLPLRMLRGGQSHAGGAAKESAAKESTVATASAACGRGGPPLQRRPAPCPRQPPGGLACGPGPS